MANYIDICGHRTINKPDNMAEATIDYYQIPIFGPEYFFEEILEWINDNLNGDWTYFSFSVPDMRITYCFKLDEDIMAFKLDWT